ncbi:hypothetical protein ACWCQS_05395 [Streptomyces sp. NPDC002076]
MLADDLAATAVAAGLDLQEQPRAADLASGLGEAGIEVCLERLQDAVGAAFAGGGEQLVEVDVAESADGLAVEVQTAGDRADRPAFLQQAVNVLVAVAEAFDDLGVGRLRGRQQHRGRLGHCGCFRRRLLLGAFAQAVAVLMAGLLHCGGQVL